MHKFPFLVSPDEYAGSADGGEVVSVDKVATQATEPESKPEVKPVEEPVKSEPTTLDLLCDIDFSVDYKPLTPEIKVPQVSEKVVIKPSVPRTEVARPSPKEEVIERPAKQDIFSDPSLLNKFTQEVKRLQNMTDSLMNTTASGLTVLDTKWKMLQDVQVS